MFSSVVRRASGNKSQLLSKHAQFFERVFNGDDIAATSTAAWDELFLLRVNRKFLERCILLTSEARLEELTPSIREVFAAALARLSPEELPQRTHNALEILVVFLFHLCRKKYHNFGFAVSELVCGHEHAGTFFPELVRRCMLITVDTSVRSDTRATALRLLLVLATARPADQNSLLGFLTDERSLRSLAEALAVLMSERDPEHSLAHACSDAAALAAVAAAAAPPRFAAVLACFDAVDAAVVFSGTVSLLAPAFGRGGRVHVLAAADAAGTTTAVAGGPLAWFRGLVAPATAKSKPGDSAAFTPTVTLAAALAILIEISSAFGCQDPTSSANAAQASSSGSSPMRSQGEGERPSNSTARRALPQEQHAALSTDSRNTDTKFDPLARVASDVWDTLAAGVGTVAALEGLSVGALRYGALVTARSVARRPSFGQRASADALAYLLDQLASACEAAASADLEIDLRASALAIAATIACVAVAKRRIAAPWARVATALAKAAQDAGARSQRDAAEAVIVAGNALVVAADQVIDTTIALVDTVHALAQSALAWERALLCAGEQDGAVAHVACSAAELGNKTTIESNIDMIVPPSRENAPEIAAALGSLGADCADKAREWLAQAVETAIKERPDVLVFDEL